MNAEQWMELAINGRVSQVLIPMGFQPTLPELYRGIDGWRIRFFFYGMSLYGGAQHWKRGLPTGIFIGHQTCGFV